MSRNEEKVRSHPASLAIGLLTGFMITGASMGGYFQGEKENSYRDGFAAGKHSCTEPSRLEKAARFLAD